VNPVCSPNRASYLTGLMPSQHGVHNWLGREKITRGIT
jgi:arylsulfatase A-like enzyme